jgi:hypothetical protein
MRSALQRVGDLQQACGGLAHRSPAEKIVGAVVEPQAHHVTDANEMKPRFSNLEKR